MRILFTQRELIVRAGSEMFTVEAARGLRERGHEVAVWAQRYGDLASALHAYGIPVYRALKEIPVRPEVIHGQHHMQAMTALAFFPEVPIVYHCHGKPWIATPPRHRQIRHYIAMAQGMKDEMETLHQIPRSSITVVNNAVNLERYNRVRTPPARITRAIAFGNNFVPNADTEQLSALCREQDITLDFFGLNLGNVHARPEHLLQDYDLAFAIGRCAIEAMACGCAVIPVSSGMAGTLVTPENFSRWAASNFAPRWNNPADRVSAEWLAEELARYRPDSIAAVTQHLREEYNLDKAISALETIYHNAIRAFPVPDDRTADLTDLALYLEGLSRDVDLTYATTMETEDLTEQRARYQQIKDRVLHHQALQKFHEEQNQHEKLRDRAAKLETRVKSLEQKNEGLAAKWQVTSELLRRSWLGRLYLSRLRRHWEGSHKRPADDEETGNP